MYIYNIYIYTNKYIIHRYPSLSIAMKLNRDQLRCHRSPFQIASLDTNGPCTSIDHRLEPGETPRFARVGPQRTPRTPCLVMIRCDESMRQPENATEIQKISQNHKLESGQRATDYYRHTKGTWFDVVRPLKDQGWYVMDSSICMHTKDSI